MTLVAEVLWLGLAVLPWALGLSVCVICLLHSGFTVKKRDENVGQGNAQDKSENTPLNQAARLTRRHGARQTASINEVQRHSQSQGTRPLLVGGPRPKCSRNPIWKKTAMVSVCVLTLAAFAAVAPAEAVDYVMLEEDGNRMRALDEAATTEEELRLALKVAREEAKAARIEAQEARADASALAAARDDAEAVRVELEAALTAREELTGQLGAALSAAREQAHALFEPAKPGTSAQLLEAIHSLVAGGLALPSRDAGSDNDADGKGLGVGTHFISKERKGSPV